MYIDIEREIGDCVEKQNLLLEKLLEQDKDRKKKAKWREKERDRKMKRHWDRKGGKEQRELENRSEK